MIDARVPGPLRTAPAFVVLALLFAVGCAVTRLDAGLLVLEDGAELGGSIAVERLWIPAGATVRVGRDLDLVARGIVRIDGVLAVSDAAEMGLSDAPDVRIASALVIEIRGAIRGGRGRNGDLRAPRGGDGSTLDLEAPLVRIGGELRGGGAGDGGPSGAGGTGGAVLVDGSLQRRFDAHSFWQIVGGRGGTGGSPGGDGGASGAALSTVSDELRTRLREHGAEIEAELDAFPEAKSGHDSR